MEVAKLHPAELDEESLQILREAEASINRCTGAEGDSSAKIFLIALNSKR